MTKRNLTAAIAAFTLVAAMAPAMGAIAQDYHDGDRDAGRGSMYDGAHRDQANGDDQRGDHSWNHGNGYGRGNGGRGWSHGNGYGRGHGRGYGPGGSVLGAYAGHPYYCRNHHHWRWNHREERYGYDYSRGGYC